MEKLLTFDLFRNELVLDPRLFGWLWEWIGWMAEVFWKPPVRSRLNVLEDQIQKLRAEFVSLVHDYGKEKEFSMYFPNFDSIAYLPRQIRNMGPPG
jgi:hypothetical protein